MSYHKKYIKVAASKSGDSPDSEFLGSDNRSFPVQIQSIVNLPLTLFIGISTYSHLLKLGLGYSIKSCNTLKARYCMENLTDDVMADGISVNPMIFR
jgi:hypothetical protein